MSDFEKPEKQKPCSWLDPSDESLPSLAMRPPQDNREKSKRAPNAIPGLAELAMPGFLTISEKEYWRNRIEKRIEQKVEAICAKEPCLIERLQQESRQRTLASLGLLEWQTELDAIEHQKARLEIRRREIERSMLAHIRGVSVKDIDDYESYRHHREVDQAIARRQAVHHDELLAESEIGQDILKLRAGKGTLIDAVWLSTSRKQVQEIWLKMTELLKDEQSSFEREALTIITEAD